jgi:hypothetical protein
MTESTQRGTITVDGVVYVLDDLSDEAKIKIVHIQFSEAQIQQLQNEVSISNTAREGYLRELRSEMSQAEGNII